MYLGQQTAFCAKQVTASFVDFGMSLVPAFLRGLVAFDGDAAQATWLSEGGSGLDD